MARHLACRNSQVIAVLVAANITTLLLFFYPHNVHDTLGTPNDLTHWQQHEKLAPVTVTVTAVATATRTVEIGRPPAPPPLKTPGPAFCNACSQEDPLCTLYGEHNLARSRVYEGANARFRRVIANALAGKPTKIGVLGGSVTKGHGLPHNSVENWTVKFLEAWKALFPQSKTTLINGAVPATGSDYLSMCFGEHIDEDVDLVIVELLINDQRLESNALAYEWLIRGLLSLPHNPAVINLHTIGLSFEFITTGGDLHTPIAEYYDSPVISVRNMLTHHILKNAHLDEYYFTKLGNGKPDWRHVGVQGHRVMADVLAAYTQRQICAVEREKTHPTPYAGDGTLPGAEGLDTIPRLRLFQKYDRETVTGPVKPMCQSIRTDKHPLNPIESKGWEKWAYEGQSEKSYLVARQPGAIIKFNVIAAVMGRVRITYLRSKTFGLGDVWCWLDDNRQKGTRIVSWWKQENINLARVEVVTDNAKPGEHVLTCELMKETSDPGGGHEFRLIAVDAS
ncbi:hypothetical protein K439DRAFT_1407534 [Ramaria rubella]|nr:hypothetical protein K439DRAFT_1407534 [Ramaria rubella]